MDGMYTVADVSQKLKITPQYVRQLINKKQLKADRIGNQWIITESSLSNYIRDYEIIIEPDDHERRSSALPNIVALSFFSGAMGLDIGMSNGGIDAILACEFDKTCRKTIAINKPDIALISDINHFEAEDILRYAKIPAGRQVDIIFGGPPCQAFSTAGARRGLDDVRGNVFLKYIDIIDQIHPTYFVIENVRGLLSAPYPYADVDAPVKGGALCVILDKLRKAGYSISFELYNAANFGAPQIRERVVIIGKLGNQKVPYLTPTHSEKGENGLPVWNTLKDAIGGMDEQDQHYVEFPEKRLKYFRMLKDGQYWKDLPLDIQKEAMGAKLQLGGGKTGFFRRLSFDKPSPTLVTHPAMPATDLCHPTMDRPLSVEEYSRIQEFPPDWVICGSIQEKYKQIGNAVPIKLGEAIAKTILEDMAGKSKKTTKGYSYSRYRDTNEITWQKNMDAVLEKARLAQQEKLEQDTII